MGTISPDFRRNQGTPDELALYLNAGGQVFFAYCHNCHESGLYYGPSGAQDGFVICPLCSTAEDRSQTLDLMPMNHTIMRSRTLFVDGRHVRSMTEPPRPLPSLSTDEQVMLDLVRSPGTVSQVALRTGLRPDSVRSAVHKLAEADKVEMVAGRPPYVWRAVAV